jgi:hypothetical protein
VVVELHGDDVVLARESWWWGNAQSELPTVRPKAATAALVGDRTLAAIGGQQGSTSTSKERGSLHRG